MDRHVSRLAGDRHCGAHVEIRVGGVDRAAKGSMAVMIEHGTPVGPRHHLQWPVLFGHVIEQNADREHTLVGMRIERPVLVPFDG